MHVFIPGEARFSYNYKDILDTVYVHDIVGSISLYNDTMPCIKLNIITLVMFHNIH